MQSTINGGGNGIHRLQPYRLSSLEVNDREPGQRINYGCRHLREIELRFVNFNVSIGGRALSLPMQVQILFVNCVKFFCAIFVVTTILRKLR